MVPIGNFKHPPVIVLPSSTRYCKTHTTHRFAHPKQEPCTVGFGHVQTTKGGWHNRHNGASWYPFTSLHSVISRNIPITKRQSVSQSVQLQSDPREGDGSISLMNSSRPISASWQSGRHFSAPGELKPPDIIPFSAMSIPGDDFILDYFCWKERITKHNRLDIIRSCEKAI